MPQGRATQYSRARARERENIIGGRGERATAISARDAPLQASLSVWVGREKRERESECIYMRVFVCVGERAGISMTWFSGARGDGFQGASERESERRE